MKHLRYVATVLVLAIFGGLLWLAYYAHSDGFTNRWKKLIQKEFAKHHMLVEIPKLTIDPFQGLVANDVQLLQEQLLPDGSRPEMASISKVRLDLDVAKLLRKERSLERIELASTDLSLPYDRTDPKSRRVDLKVLSATIDFRRGRLEVVEALANFYGIKVRLTGALLTAEEATEGSLLRIDSEKIKAAEPILTQVIHYCEGLKYPEGEAPLLDLVVSGDLTKPETLRVQASVTGRELGYGAFTVKSLQGEAIVDAEALHLTTLNASDHDDGWLQANATFPFDRTPATFKLESSLSLDQFAAQIVPDHSLWDWLSLSSAPVVDISGTVPLRKSTEESPLPPVDIMGTVETGTFQLKGETFESFSGGFHLKGEQMFCRDLKLTHARGTSKGKVIYLPEEGLRYDLSIGMDPAWMQALPLSPEMASFLERWHFRDTSSVAFDVRGKRTRDNQASWEHEGRLSVTHCEFESAPLDYLTVNFKVDPYTYYFSDLQAQLEPDPDRGYPGGTVEAENVNLSTRSKVVVVSNVRGRVHPAQVVRCFDQSIADRLDHYQFDQAPEVKIGQGTLDLANNGQTNLRAEIKVLGEMIVPVADQDLPFSLPRFQLFFYRESLLVRVFNAGLLDGQVKGQVEIKDLMNKQSYGADLDVSDVDFGKLAAYYFPEYKAGGQLTGNLKWSGEGTKVSAFKGGGIARLENCPITQVPVLGPLSLLLDPLIGKTELTHAEIRELTAKFYLASGKVVFEEILADMNAYRIDGKGEINLSTEALAFQATLKNQTTVGALLNVLYQAFGTYECTGTLDEPKWRMVSQLDPSKVESLLKKGEEKLPLDAKQLLKLDPTGLINDLLDEKTSEEDPQS